jgi:uncharacterized protein YllA (UPF0747 family)
MKCTRQAHVPSQDPLGLAFEQGRILASARFRTENLHARQSSLQARPFDRAQLSEWLREAFPPGTTPTTAQQSHLDQARMPDTLFVITGQQPGLLGGPFLSWLKARTAIALAERASQTLGVQVVPLFWMAGDDSDLAEANVAEFLWEGKTSDLPVGSAFPAPCRLPFTDAQAKFPVGERLLSSAAARALTEQLPQTWPGEWRDEIRSAYASGHSLVDGFRALLQRALGHRGLLFVDGNSPRLRQLTAPALQSVLTRAPEFFAALRQGETRLRETTGLHPQVVLPPHALPAFLRYRKPGEMGPPQRLRLTSEFVEGCGRIACPDAYGRENFAAFDLAKAGDGLELNHDALTRMVITESALPVLGHVLGPAEMRYAAQLGDVFLAFTGGQPLLHPRQSALLVPQELAATLEAHGVLAGQWPALTPKRWRDTLRAESWRARDASLAPPTSWTSAWQNQALAWFERHVPGQPRPEAFLRRLAGDLQRFETLAQDRIARLSSLYRHANAFLRPLALGQGQDRRLNLASVAAHLGWNGLEELAANLDPLRSGVQVVTFET